MVFFTCNHCGESLKKPSVEKHYQWKSCRGAVPYLTCVDCLKDFHGDEFKEHTKCITEEEKYSAKGFVPKACKNKGAQKQESWTEILQNLVNKPGLDQHMKRSIEKIANQTNVPRKKPKFINFIKNSLKISVDNAQKIWNIVEEALGEFKKVTEANNIRKRELETTTEDNDDATSTKEVVSQSVSDESRKKKKKKKNSTANGVDGGNEQELNGHTKKRSLDLATTENEKEESPPKKKKKKNKNSEAQQSTTSDDVTPLQEVVKELVSDKGGKKKKKKNSSTNGEDGGNEQEINGHTKKRTLEIATVENEIEEPSAKKKKKKNKIADAQYSTTSDDADITIPNNEQHLNGIDVGTQFNWQTEIGKILMKKKSITIDNLKAKVVTKYLARTSSEDSPRIQKLFLKKLKTIPNIDITEEYVKLV